LIAYLAVSPAGFGHALFSGNEILPSPFTSKKGILGKGEFLKGMKKRIFYI